MKNICIHSFLISQNPRHCLFVAAILCLHVFLSLWGSFEKAPVFDEPSHLTSGYLIWKTNDFRMDPESGILPKKLASLPLLFMQPDVSGISANAWENADQDFAAGDFFYKGDNDPDTLLFAGRFCICLLSGILGFVVYKTARMIFGNRAGIISLLLYCFSPTMIANAGLVTSDMCVTLFFFLSAISLWKLAHCFCARNVFFSGLSTAGAILSKMSGVIIVVAGLFLFIIAVWQNRPIVFQFWRQKCLYKKSAKAWGALASILLTGLVVICLIWVAYGFRYSAFSPDQTLPGKFRTSWQYEQNGAGTLFPPIAFFRQHHLLPEAYLFGFTQSISHSQYRESFLVGKYSLDGFWWFFPMVFLLKTPVGFFGILILSIWFIVRKLSPENQFKLTPFLVLFLVYSAFAIKTNLNIGHRHLLPLYPILFLVAGAAGQINVKTNRIKLLAVLIFLMAFVTESLVCWPHSLSFVNIAAKGPREGYRIAADSSYDWGQDLYRLPSALAKVNMGPNRNLPVYLSYFGGGNPYSLGIDFQLLPGYTPYQTTDPVPFSHLTPGIYCISSTMLHQIYIGPFGPWCEEFENAFQDLKTVIARYEGLTPTPSKMAAFLDDVGGGERLYKGIRVYEDLRFGRLCALLRQRQPNARAGYSILLYCVDDRLLDQALNGPPPPMQPGRGLRSRTFGLQ